VIVTVVVVAWFTSHVISSNVAASCTDTWTSLVPRLCVTVIVVDDPSPMFAENFAGAPTSAAASPVPVTSAFVSVTAPVRVLNDATRSSTSYRPSTCRRRAS
jgi:hypothetical protein